MWLERRARRREQRRRVADGPRPAHRRRRVRDPARLRRRLVRVGPAPRPARPLGRGPRRSPLPDRDRAPRRGRRGDRREPPTATAACASRSPAGSRRSGASGATPRPRSSSRWVRSGRSHPPKRSSSCRGRATSAAPPPGLKTISYAENVRALAHAHDGRRHRGDVRQHPRRPLRGDRLQRLRRARRPGAHAARRCRVPARRDPRARDRVLCHRSGIACEEVAVPMAALRDADEAFLTSSTREVQGIRSVDGVDLPVAPGPVTERLRAAFRALVASGRDLLIRVRLAPCGASAVERRRAESAVGVGAEVDDVADGHDVLRAVVVAHHRARRCRSVSAARPSTIRPPPRSTRTRRPSVAERARARVGERRRGRRGGGRGRRGRRRAARRGRRSDPPRPRTRWPCPRGRAGPRRGRGCTRRRPPRPAPSRGPRSASASSPASLRSRTTRSLGHFSPGVDPGDLRDRVGQREPGRHRQHRPRRVGRQCRAAAAPTRGATTRAPPPTPGRGDPVPRSGGRPRRPGPSARPGPGLVEQRTGSWSRGSAKAGSPTPDRRRRTPADRSRRVAAGSGIDP